MLAYYTIERHINKKPNNGEWVVNRQSHFVLPTGSGNRFSIAFWSKALKATRLKKCWDISGGVEHLVSTWLYLSAFFSLRSWKSTRYMSCCETKNYPFKVRFLQRWFQRNYLWMFSVTFFVHGDHLLVTPPTVAWSLTNEKDDNWCWLA